MTEHELSRIIDQAAEDRLTMLDLSGMQLTSLPSKIGQLQNLTWLDLSDNKLTNLPSKIGQLKNITWLELRANQLKELPTEISELTKLAVLDLSGNQLARVPTKIGLLQDLTQLNLGSNKLEGLPRSLAELKQLTWLDLSNNQFKRLPTSITGLKNITWLDISSNQLTNLPTTVAKLKTLTWLNLGNNNLMSLPTTIAQLEELEELILKNNQLTDLPEELEELILKKSQLPNVRGKPTRLDLSRNQLPIPSELLTGSHKPETVTNYYLKQQEEPQKPLNEAKMLLVGQGSVGKSSLVRRLIKGDFDPHESKTEGIEIQQWKIEVSNKKIRINLWDFGGQEIMHATHQLFLTKRSLYLLVIDARLGEGENRIEYWLKIIQSNGGDSPVIIVVNKIDQHPFDLDKKGLQSKYEIIKGIVELSCKTGQGLENLRSIITTEISNLQHINDSLLLSWFKVKVCLERLGKDYIDYNEYEEICQMQKVEDHNGLIQLLHDLGVVVNFREDLRLGDLCILNPRWVINGIYKILNDNLLITQYKGILEWEQLNRILNCQEYPQNKRLYIIDLMRKFELCFDLEGFANEKVLIPALLPKEEPYTGNWNNTLLFEYHYPVLPNSIISRFIVRTNDKVYKDTHWRNGVVLMYENNTALVKADYEDKKICICIQGQGSDRREFLTAIRSEFQAIHKTIQGLEPKEKIPLPNHPKTVVDYQHLRMLEKKNILEYIPEGLEDPINVKQLLDGVESEDIRRHKSKATLNERFFVPSIFVQGDYRPMTEITNNNQGANIGNFVNEAKDNAQVTASNFSQTSDATTIELLHLITTMRQTAVQFPKEIQEEIFVDIDDVEAEIKKPENQRNLTRLRKRLIALATIGSMIATPIAGVTDFANSALELGSKLGIELQLSPAP